MSDDNQPIQIPIPVDMTTAASVPVQLARMEGTLNLVADRIHGLSSRVEKVESDVGDLKARTQSLSESAESARVTAAEVAAALGRAEDERDAKARRAWSPFAKAITLGLAVVSVSQLVIQYQMWVSR